MCVGMCVCVCVWMVNGKGEEKGGWSNKFGNIVTTKGELLVMWHVFVVRAGRL